MLAIVTSAVRHAPKGLNEILIEVGQSWHVPKGPKEIQVWGSYIITMQLY
ncbi:hypothetical protein WN944_027722 [Citrus x changshan-huyou]|uniref:Uncharacterized protein n=1 Tax=Citrus x changshan-huyou TaxID=2935761 RepID=A0AAP0Q8S2_9ROSI